MIREAVSAQCPKLTFRVVLSVLVTADFGRLLLLYSSMGFPKFKGNSLSAMAELSANFRAILCLLCFQLEPILNEFVRPPCPHRRNVCS